MRVFGLTGNIGTGKSTVAGLFAEKGVPVIDADLVARDVVARGTEGLREIEARFPGVLAPDGSLDRKALAARPDLKAAKLSEHAADVNIRLQNAQRIPDLTVGPGVEQVPSGTSTYIFGVGITLPTSDRNQGERAKALIEKQKAQNHEQLITNQILSDVDKALVAFEIQKRRVDLYRTGVLTKVNNIQNLTEYSMKAGESSILELLDAIRTRRETLAGFYQTLFDYQSSLLDLELATATPLQK